MCSEIAIQVQSLSKCFQIYDAPRDRLKQMLWRGRRQYYREFWALQDVSFTVKKGETVGIIGRNGSGKSTLLQMICNTLHPTSGHVQTQGRVAALLELGSGFNPEFTGRENVYMNASILGLSKQEIDARFADITAFADIGDFIEQPVKTYSSGMMLRLAFAVIAHVDADILVVDEALAVGDAFFTQKCMRFLRQFMETGTVLFVSHDSAAVKSLCSKAIWLDQGLLLRQGSPKEVCDLYLQALYEEQQGQTGAPMPDGPNPDGWHLDPAAPSFGKGGARIVQVELLDEHSRPLRQVSGCERATLRITALARETLDAPIIGFFIRDRLGQTLFGDNTFLSFQHQPAHCPAEGQLVASFTFSMPTLPAGDYSIAVAIANGTQQDHVQHHWIHDALIFKSESTSVTTGLIGIPMLRIELQAEKHRTC